MKISKSQLKQIIKEEYDRIISEAESKGFAVYAGPKAAAARSLPIEKKTFATKEEAEAFMKQIASQPPYTGMSFRPGNKWELTVGEAPAPLPPPAPTGPVEYWVEQDMGRWFGPYKTSTEASLSHDRGMIHAFPKGEKPS